MSGRLPREFIDQLLSRIDVVEIVDRCVPLKKAGKDFKACCPFHDEKTPSFTVSPSKQFYHCFGCGASGTAITFVMEFNHLGFREAVEDLANAVGLPIPDTGLEHQDNDTNNEESAARWRPSSRSVMPQTTGKASPIPRLAILKNSLR